eukprot:6361935-Amphidinium_carterae.1
MAGSKLPLLVEVSSEVAVCHLAEIWRFAPICIAKPECLQPAQALETDLRQPPSKAVVVQLKCLQEQRPGPFQAHHASVPTQVPVEP